MGFLFNDGHNLLIISVIYFNLLTIAFHKCIYGLYQVFLEQNLHCIYLLFII